MQKLSLKKPRTACPNSVYAFSLVELLVVIAIIAIIASVAIPSLANLSNQANYAKSQKNAQILASVAAAARSAGYTNNWVDVTNAIALLTASNGSGLSIELGNGSVHLGVSTIRAHEVTNCLPFLDIISSSVPDALVYRGPDD